MCNIHNFCRSITKTWQTYIYIHTSQKRRCSVFHTSHQIPTVPSQSSKFAKQQRRMENCLTCKSALKLPIFMVFTVQKRQVTSAQPTALDSSGSNGNKLVVWLVFFSPPLGKICASQNWIRSHHTMQNNLLENSSPIAWSLLTIPTKSPKAWVPIAWSLPWCVLRWSHVAQCAPQNPRPPRHEEGGEVATSHIHIWKLAMEAKKG